MTMSPLYPCGKPCSRGNHNETVINLPLFNHQWNYDGIMALNLNPVGVFSILQSNRKFSHICTVTIVEGQITSQNSVRAFVIFEITLFFFCDFL